MPVLDVVTDASAVSPSKRARTEPRAEEQRTVLRFAKLSENATTPTRGSSKAAGYDLYRLVGFYCTCTGVLVWQSFLNINTNNVKHVLGSPVWNQNVLNNFIFCETVHMITPLVPWTRPLWRQTFRLQFLMAAMGEWVSWTEELLFYILVLF